MIVACRRQAALEVIDRPVAEERSDDRYDSPSGDARIVFILHIHVVVIYNNITVPGPTRLPHKVVPGSLAIFCCDILAQGIKCLKPVSWLFAPSQDE